MLDCPSYPCLNNTRPRIGFRVSTMTGIPENSSLFFIADRSSSPPIFGIIRSSSISDIVLLLDLMISYACSPSSANRISYSSLSISDNISLLINSSSATRMVLLPSLNNDSNGFVIWHLSPYLKYISGVLKSSSGLIGFVRCALSPDCRLL